MSYRPSVGSQISEIWKGFLEPTKGLIKPT